VNITLISLEWALFRTGRANLLMIRTTHLSKQGSTSEGQLTILNNINLSINQAEARAFASKAKVLFADEPTGNLDTNTDSHIID